MKVSLNVFGTDEAVAEVKKELEAERARDPSFPWSVGLHEQDGDVLNFDAEERDEARVRQFALALSRRHPMVAILAVDFVMDREDQEPVSVTFVTYSKGRRRASRPITLEVDRAARLRRLFKRTYQISRRWERSLGTSEPTRNSAKSPRLSAIG